MKTKTITNIIISTSIVFLFFFIGHMLVKDNDHSEIGYFLILLLASIYSLIVSAVTTIIVVSRNKYWNSILFISSCLTNFVASYVPIMWLTTPDSSAGVSSIFLITFSLPPLICIYQVYLFIKNNKIDREQSVEKL